jgi:hypothetical protein
MAHEDPVERSLFFAFFKLLQIEELSGREEALEWARMVLEDADYRASFADQVRERTG